MIDESRVLVVVAARSGSKGLPNKNIRLLNSKPLLAYPILAARNAKCVDKVLLSTDSEQYRQVGEEYGASIPFLRAGDLASDTATSVDVVLDVLDRLGVEGETFEYVALLEPTSPLTEANDLDAAIAQLHLRREFCDSVVGVQRLESSHPAYALKMDSSDRISPYSGGEFAAMPRRQELEPLFVLDGSLYVSKVSALRSKKTFYHEATQGLVFEKRKGFEIDDHIDFLCVQALMDEQREQR